MKKVITPATSANLGPGFDILGLALCLYNIYYFKYSDCYRFKNFAKRYANQDNLLVKSYEYVLKCEQKPITPLYIRQEKNIPIARGLGSSSSLIVAGVLIANDALENKLTKEEMLFYASKIEGHPDNVAPCLYGGLVACKIIDKTSSIINKYPVNPKLKFLFSIPDFILSTTVSRKVLPDCFSLEAISSNYSNLLILLKGLELAKESYLKTGIKDFIHTPYRKKLIKNYDLLENILNKYTICHTLSGAGPTIISITKDYSKDLFKETEKINFKTWELKIDNKGAFISE